MFLTINEALANFYAFFQIGLLLSLAYELLRIFRVVLPHGIFLAAAEDFAFLVLCALFSYGYAVEFCGGEYRFYYAAASAIGAGLYFCTVGRISGKIDGFIAKLLMKLYSAIYRYLIRPVVNAIVKIAQKISAKIGYIYKNAVNTLKSQKFLSRNVQKKPIKKVEGVIAKRKEGENANGLSTTAVKAKVVKV